MSSKAANALVLTGSAALLGGALAFQYLGHLAPCEMCLWQRWPHVAALGIGLLAWARSNNRFAVAVAAVCLLVGAGLGFFHAGVEYHWWTGPQACTAPALASGTSFVAAALAAPLIRCDAAAWTMFGISMAGYNGLVSTVIGATALWLNQSTR